MRAGRCSISANDPTATLTLQRGNASDLGFSPGKVLAWADTMRFLYYNFVRVHQTPRVTPAMAAGATKRLWEIKDFVNMIEAWEASR
jgi:hypothetical protein